jgi:hypothetical protein
MFDDLIDFYTDTLWMMKVDKVAKLMKQIIVHWMNTSNTITQTEINYLNFMLNNENLFRNDRVVFIRNQILTMAKFCSKIFDNLMDRNNYVITEYIYTKVFNDFIDFRNANANDDNLPILTTEQEHPSNQRAA